MKKPLTFILLIAPLVLFLGVPSAEATGRTASTVARARAVVSVVTARRVTVPEFSGKASGAAIALLVGGVLVGTDRLRRKPSA